MADKLHFAIDLYQGTTEYYDRYRLRYPDAMTRTSSRAPGSPGRGACSTWPAVPASLPFRWRSFAEVWAVDRELDFVQMVQAKADKLGAGNIRPVTADAETLDGNPGTSNWPSSGTPSTGSTPT